MRALTVWQPWAHCIAHLGKPLENRDWPPPVWLLGKRLAIHAGKTLDREACELIEELFDLRLPATYPHGAIVAVVTVPGAVTESESEWFSGKYGWLLKDKVALPTPVPCRGAQGLWNLPADVEDLVMGQLDLVTPTAAASR